MKREYRDGVALTYEDTGEGAPPLLFVHGWCCDHTYFAPQVEHFGARYRCVAVDLRGHGESDAPEQPYTIAGFADDLAWLCGEIGLERPVAIGHSMGGAVVLELAARFPDLAAAAVAVDSPLLPAESRREAITQFARALWEPGYRELAQRFVADNLFIPTDDPERKARIVAAMADAPQHVMASAMEQLFAWDGAAAAAAVSAPVLALDASRSLSDMARLRELCPSLVVGQTVGAGHFNHLEVPEQVNAMIARFLEVAVPAPAFA